MERKRDHGVSVFSKDKTARLRIEPTSKKSNNQKYLSGAIAIASFFMGDRKTEKGINMMLEPNEASLVAFKIEQISNGIVPAYKIEHGNTELIFGRRKVDGSDTVEYGITLKKGDQIINIATPEADFIHSASMLRFFAQKCNWQEAVTEQKAA